MGGSVLEMHFAGALRVNRRIYICRRSESSRRVDGLEIVAGHLKIRREIAEAAHRRKYQTWQGKLSGSFE